MSFPCLKWLVFLASGTHILTASPNVSYPGLRLELQPRVVSGTSDHKTSTFSSIPDYAKERCMQLGWQFTLQSPPDTLNPETKTLGPRWPEVCKWKSPLPGATASSMMDTVGYFATVAFQFSTSAAGPCLEPRCWFCLFSLRILNAA